MTNWNQMGRTVTLLVSAIWMASVMACAGPMGPAGPLGPTGEQGPQGERGAAGPEGPQGAQGEAGATGEKGQRGDAGPDGADGADGEDGAQGEQGPRGEQGEQGEGGPQGERGAKGDRGEQGERSLQGEQGPQGPPGPPGDTVLIPTASQPSVSIPAIAPRSSSLPPVPTISVANLSVPPLASTTAPRGNCPLYNEDIDWLEQAYPDYSICYTEPHSRDVGPVSHWLAEAKDWLFAKYDIDQLVVHDYSGRTSRPMELYLVLIPESDGNAGVGLTRFMCCYDTDRDTSDVNIAWIPYLAPSSSDWLGYPCLGQLCTPPNQGHIKNFMHEFTHAIQHTAGALRCEGRRGCAVYAASHWSSEGLAEYEGTFNTTAHNRTETFEKLVDYVSDNDLVYLATSLDYVQSIQPGDTYFGGNLLMKFLADRFGEDIHYRLTHSDVSTLEDVLLSEYQAEDIGVIDLFAELKAWMEEQE